MTDMSCPSISNDFDFDLVSCRNPLLILLNQRRNIMVVCCLGGLLGAVGDIDDLQSCLFVSLERRLLRFQPRKRGLDRTRRKALLELVGLVGVLEDKSVQESVAADLELGLAGLAVTLDPGGCIINLISKAPIQLSR